MAKLLDTITLGGYTKQVNERQSYYVKPSATALSANVMKTVATQVIANPGLYVFTGGMWFKDGTSTGARTAYLEINSNVATNAYVQTSQRAVNQYGLYMQISTTMYIDASLKTVAFQLNAMSSMACNNNEPFLLCERVYPVLDA